MCNLSALHLGQDNLTRELSQFFQDFYKCLQDFYKCMENLLEILERYNNQCYGSLPDITRFTSIRELNFS
jgi:hypothetical protein